MNKQNLIADIENIYDEKRYQDTRIDIFNILEECLGIADLEAIKEYIIKI